MFRRSDRAGFNRRFALLDNAIGNFLHHLLEQHAQMSVWPVIRGRDVFDAIGVGNSDSAFDRNRKRSRWYFAAWTCLRQNEQNRQNSSVNFVNSVKEVFEERIVNLTTLRMVLDAKGKWIIAEADLLNDVVHRAPGLDFQAAP